MALPTGFGSCYFVLFLTNFTRVTSTMKSPRSFHFLLCSQNRWLLSYFLPALADFLAPRPEGRVTVLKCKLLKFLYAPWFLLSHHGELQVLLFTVISFKLNISRYWQDFFSKTIWLVGHESAKGSRDSIQSLRMVLLSLNGTKITYKSWQTILPSLLRFFRYFFRCFRLYGSSIVIILH